jgi:hypothetical protein
MEGAVARRTSSAARGSAPLPKRDGIRNQIVELLDDQGRPRGEPTLDVESEVCGPPRNDRSRDGDRDPFGRSCRMHQ